MVLLHTEQKNGESTSEHYFTNPKGYNWESRKIYRELPMAPKLPSLGAELSYISV